MVGQPYGSGHWHDGTTCSGRLVGGGDRRDRLAAVLDWPSSLASAWVVHKRLRKVHELLFLGRRQLLDLTGPEIGHSPSPQLLEIGARTQQLLTGMLMLILSHLLLTGGQGLSQLVGLYAPTRDRTWNLSLRRRAPYPLGHGRLRFHQHS
jgi:hypothetical protein